MLGSGIVRNCVQGDEVCQAGAAVERLASLPCTLRMHVAGYMKLCPLLQRQQGLVAARHALGVQHATEGLGQVNQAAAPLHVCHPLYWI